MSVESARGRVGCTVQAEIQRDKHKAERELERNCPDQRCTVGEATQRWESWAPSPTLCISSSPLSQEPPILQEECVCSQRVRNFFLNILDFPEHHSPCPPRRETAPHSDTGWVALLVIVWMGRKNQVCSQNSIQVLAVAACRKKGTDRPRKEGAEGEGR